MTFREDASPAGLRPVTAQMEAADSPVGLYRLLLAAVGVGLLLCIIVRVDESAFGTARVRGGQVEAVVLLPVGVQQQLRPGQLVRVSMSRDADVNGRIVTVERPIGYTAAQELLARPDPLGSGNADAFAVVRVRLDAPAPVGATARTRVLLRRPRLVDILVPNVMGG